MKRELSYALEAQSKLTESLGRTRSSSKSQPANVDPLESEALNESEVQLSSSIDENRVRIHTSNAVRKNKRLKTNSRKDDDFLMIEQSKGACLSPIKEEERDFEALVPRRVTRSAVKPDEGRLRSGNVGYGDCIGSREVEDEVVTVTRSVVQNSNKKIRLKKLKNKSTVVPPDSDKKVKLKNRPTVLPRNSDKKVNRPTVVPRNSDKKVNRPTVVPRNSDKKVNRPTVVPRNSDKKVNRSTLVLRNSDKKVNRPTVVLRNSDKKVKLKNRPTAVLRNSDKKIKLKKPTTVQELIETGLLEGYPVSYKTDKKGNVLRGTIKDKGILCFCSLCKGTKVVMPSEFEVHARNLYKHEYICLENGKRFHEVVKACMRTPLKRLEKIIRSLVGPLPSKGSNISPNCMESEAELNTVGNSITLQAAPRSFGLRSGRMRTNKTFENVRASEQPLDADSVDKLEKIQQKIQNPWASEQPLDSDSVHRPEKIQQKIQKPASEQPFDANSVDRLEKIQQKIKKPASEQPVAANSVDRLEKIQQKIKKSSSKLVPVTNSPASTELCTSSRTKGREKMKRKALELPLAATSPKNDSVDIQEKSERKMRKLLSRSVPVSNVKSDSKSRWKITKKDQRMHWLVFEENGLPEGTEVGYYSNGKNLLKGHKEGSGIFCNHCGTVVSASQFEVHAGCASRKKPYGYIYTSNGVSLHELAISLLKKRNHSVKDNDDLCIICKDGGNLLLCDGCPRAFHKECASLCMIPDGKWYCLYCENMFQRNKHLANNANALAAGRVSGVDPIEQIATRCIRIVKNPNQAVAIACILCRGFDYSKSGFGSNTVILCDQCEKEYHVGCLKERNMADLKELPKEKWFCCTDCQKIYTTLQNLVNSEAEKIQEPLLDVIKKKEIVRGSEDANEIDVRWNLLSGKSTTASRETRLLLAKAVAIFHECFDPIVDPETGHDFIPTMVYGRKIRGQDFRGMYCAVLTVNTVVVSAGILRVFGPDKAELPLVATSKANQGKGYFQLLFSCIEKLLTSLEVKSLVLPAAEIAESIWTDRFSFKKITPEQLLEYRNDFWQMLTFKGTSMLEKHVPSSQDIRTDATLD